jgi:hypothetical protein
MAINGNLPGQTEKNPSTTNYFNNFYNQGINTSPMINDAVVAYFQNITGDAETGKNLASAIIFTALQQNIDPMSVISELKKLSDRNKLNQPDYYEGTTNQYAKDEFVFVPGTKGTVANCSVMTGNAFVTSTNSVSAVQVGATITGNGTYTSTSVTVLNVDIENKTLELSSNGTANVANTTLSYTNPGTWATGSEQYAKPGPSASYNQLNELDAYLTMFLNLNRISTSLLGISNNPIISPYVQRMILA